MTVGLSLSNPPTRRLACGTLAAIWGFMMKESSNVQSPICGQPYWFVSLLISCLSICVGASACEQVPLAWDAVPDTNITGYAVYYGTNSGVHPTRMDVGTNVTATVSNLAEGGTYYFVVTSYNSTNLESAPSSEVSYIVPGVVTMSYNPNSGSGPTLNFPVAPGHWYEVQATQDFKTWTTIAQTATAATNALAQCQDYQGITPYQSRFYRLVMH
jgi:hypothetical protein